MTVGERLERAETMLMLARSACSSDAAQIFFTPQMMRDALDRVLTEVLEDVYCARTSLSTKVLKKAALTSDERDGRAAHAGAAKSLSANATTDDDTESSTQ